MLFMVVWGIDVVSGCIMLNSARRSNLLLPKYPNEHQISASATLEKSDGGQESPSTSVQSHLKEPINVLSEQVTNKFASRVSKTTPTKTEGCYKKKKGYNY
jgi:hypothetical protein